MKKMLVAALPLGLALLSAPAFARVFMYPGTICQPVAGSTCIRYDQFGVNNACLAAETVECPLVHSYDGATSISQGYFVGFDRHSTQNISCALQESDSDGDLIYNVTKSTSSEAVTSKTVTWTNLSQPQNWAWRYRCSIPGFENGELSHLTTMVLISTE